MRCFYILILLFADFLAFGQSKNNLRVAHTAKGKIEIIEFGEQNTESVIYSSTQTDVFPVCSKENIIFFNSPGLSVYNLKTKVFSSLNEKSFWFQVGGFFKSSDWIFYSRMVKKESKPEIVIYNYKQKKEVKILDGVLPNISIMGNSLFYMNADNNVYDSVGFYMYILKYSVEANRSIKMDSIELNEGKVNITEIISRSDSEYYYRVYDEHEYRYYYNDKGEEKMFFNGGKAYFINGESKEQYHLTFSSDGKYAAFSERNWNELTYLVLIDLVNKTRIETPYYGSFPEIKNDKIYFISDPELFTSKNKSFRKIKNYALYAYDIKNKQATLVKKFEGGIQFLH